MMNHLFLILCIGFVHGLRLHDPASAFTKREHRMRNGRVTFLSHVGNGARSNRFSSVKTVCSLFNKVSEDSRAFEEVHARTFQAEAQQDYEYDLVIAVLTFGKQSEVMLGDHYKYHSQRLPHDTLLLYITNDGPATRALPAESIVSDTRNGTYRDAAARCVRIWQFLGGGCGGLKYKFLLQVDDDTLIMFRNLAIFVAMLQSDIGNPHNASKVIGGKMTWGQRLEVFGGNGIFATQAAAQRMTELDEEAWQEAYQDYDYGDSAVSALARHSSMPQGTLIADQSGWFGLAHEGVQNSLDGGRRVSRHMLLKQCSKTISVHKVQGREAYDRVESVCRRFETGEVQIPWGTGGFV